MGERKDASKKRRARKAAMWMAAAVRVCVFARATHTMPNGRRAEEFFFGGAGPAGVGCGNTHHDERGAPIG